MSGAGLARYRDNNQPCLWTAFWPTTNRAVTSFRTSRDLSGTATSKIGLAASAGGIAPYLANYNDLNTWLMFQVDHHPAKHDHFVATPLIRFFYKTYLLEVGYGSDNHVMVNWTVQF